jgi:hypothetical protein
MTYSRCSVVWRCAPLSHDQSTETIDLIHFDFDGDGREIRERLFSVEFAGAFSSLEAEVWTYRVYAHHKGKRRLICECASPAQGEVLSGEALQVIEKLQIEGWELLDTQSYSDQHVRLKIYILQRET